MSPTGSGSVVGVDAVWDVCDATFGEICRGCAMPGSWTGFGMVSIAINACMVYTAVCFDAICRPIQVIFIHLDGRIYRRACVGETALISIDVK